jgi:hypothetical protein
MIYKYQMSTCKHCRNYKIIKDNELNSCIECEKNAKIKKLEAENARLREALYQIAYGHDPSNWHGSIARAALEGK